MGPEQLAAVMQSVRGKSTSTPGTDSNQSADTLKARIERESEAVFSSARLWDDGIVPPGGTRGMLGMGLRAALGSRARWEAEDGGTKWGVFRM